MLNIYFLKMSPKRHIMIDFYTASVMYFHVIVSLLPFSYSEELSLAQCMALVGWIHST